MQPKESSDLWVEFRENVAEELEKRGVDETTRNVVLAALSTNASDLIVDFTGWLNSTIISAGGVGGIGVPVIIVEGVLASVALDVSGFEEGQPRNNVLEEICAESFGALVSYFTSKAVEAAATTGTVAFPEFSPAMAALAAGGSTLGYFFGNGATALLHEGWDHVFGTEYCASYNADDDHLEINFNNLELGFRQYWEEKTVEVVHLDSTGNEIIQGEIWGRANLTDHISEERDCLLACFMVNIDVFAVNNLDIELQ